MKNILLATTAVILSAGIATAEVAVSGSARMGLQYQGDIDLNNDGDTLDAGESASVTTLEKRMQLNFDASTETTSGLTFGARMRIRSNEAAGPTGASGARVYMKTGAVEVAVGNIYGAIDSMPNLYMSEVGLTALNDAGVVANTVANPATAWGFDDFTSNGNGAEGIEVMYSAGAFSGHLSYSEVTLSSGASAQDRLAAYVAYTMNDWTFALAAQDSSLVGEDKLILTVAGKIGDYGIGFAAANNDGESKVALNGSATFGATTVNGFIADEESGANVAVGLGVAYDLGGATVAAGIERDAIGTTRADLGVSFSF